MMIRRHIVGGGSCTRLCVQIRFSAFNIDGFKEQQRYSGVCRINDSCVVDGNDTVALLQVLMKWTPFLAVFFYSHLQVSGSLPNVGPPTGRTPNFINHFGFENNWNSSFQGHQAASELFGGEDNIDVAQLFQFFSKLLADSK